MSARLLLVDDEPSILSVLKALLSVEGFEVVAIHDGNQAVEAIRSQEFDLMISDIRMTPVTGMELLKLAYQLRPSMAVIMITAFGSIETAVEAVRMGAYDYITKPFKIDELLLTVKRALQYKKALSETVDLASQDAASFKLGSIVAQSAVMKNVCEMIRHVGPTNTTLLITGELGSGKSLVAKTLHEYSGRKGGPFVRVDCAESDPFKLENALFGKDDIAGAIEKAAAGTLYMEEVDMLPAGTQRKLLAMLNDKSFSRAGSSAPVPVDVRLIVGTSANLQNAIRTGEFREDLYQRLSVIPIFIKPLRERRDDIIPLVAHLLRLKLGSSTTLPTLNPSAREALMRHSWPGNVMEMDAALDFAVLQDKNTTVLSANSFPPPVAAAAASHDGAPTPGVIDDNKGRSLKSFLRAKEKEYVEQVLKHAGGDKIKAAKALDISLATLYRKLPLDEAAGTPSSSH